MAIRRRTVAFIGAVVIATLCPIATAPTGIAATAPTVRWYEGRSGTVQWALGSEFLDQLDASGAVIRFCRAARVAVDAASGVTIVTLPVHGDSAIQLDGRQSGVDAVSDCVMTITGNGATVTLTDLSFGVSSAYGSDISAMADDAYTELGAGARTRLPKAATSNRIVVTSPVILVGSAFGDALRAGPVPTMTEPTTLGLFRLALTVKPTGRPSPHNEEG